LEEGVGEGIESLRVQGEQVEARRVRVRRRAPRSTASLQRDDADEPVAATGGDEPQRACAERRLPRLEPAGIEKRRCLDGVGELGPLVCERLERVDDVDAGRCAWREQRRASLSS
jgi:hypothetical protein